MRDQEPQGDNLYHDLDKLVSELAGVYPTTPNQTEPNSYTPDNLPQRRGCYFWSGKFGFAIVLGLAAVMLWVGYNKNFVEVLIFQPSEPPVAVTIPTPTVQPLETPVTFTRTVNMVFLPIVTLPPPPPPPRITLITPVDKEYKDIPEKVTFVWKHSLYLPKNSEFEVEISDQYPSFPLLSTPVEYIGESTYRLSVPTSHAGYYKWRYNNFKWQVHLVDSETRRKIYSSDTATFTIENEHYFAGSGSGNSDSGDASDVCCGGR